MSLTLIVLEHGARLPEVSLRATAAHHDACVLAQLPDEDHRSFRQRVSSKLSRFNLDGVPVRHAQLCLGGKSDVKALERRFALAQTLLKGLPSADETELVVRGDLGDSSAGQLDLGAIVETLQALSMGFATRVRASFDQARPSVQAMSAA